MDSPVRVTFVPGDLTVDVKRGTTLIEAAAVAGLVIYAPCGGRGVCGRCAVRVESGSLAPMSAEEAKVLSRAGVDSASIRLACMARVGEGPATVRVRSLDRTLELSTSTGESRRVVVGAVDLGTSTVLALVLDDATGERLGKATVGNRQAAWGADVLSRISAALDGGAIALREAAESSIIDALGRACDDAGIPTTNLTRVVVAANTPMLSLLAGIDVTGLASHPFASSLANPVALHSSALKEAFPGSDFIAPAPVAAFVGGDLVAGLIAEGLAAGPARVAYLDIGTNAEIALVFDDDVYVCSAPAGPAIEGWGIACGGQAGEGAIISVAADAEGLWEPHVLGPEATHLAGSGLVSVVAALLRLGHVGADGLLTEVGPLENRCFVLANGVRVIGVLADPADRSVYVSQLDVRAFQYAKAAVCAGLRACAQAAGAEGVSLSEYVVAGTFGGPLRHADLVDLGVLPIEAIGRIRYAGEAALSGAAVLSLNPEAFEVARVFSSRAHHVDLAATDLFSERYVESMSLEVYSL